MSQGKVMKYDRCHLPMYVSAAVNKKLPSFNPILINWFQVFLLLQIRAMETVIVYFFKSLLP